MALNKLFFDNFYVGKMFKKQINNNVFCAFLPKDQN